MVNYWLGKKFSEEHKRKKSETMKKLGIRPPSWLGKKHSLETKLKMSKTAMGHTHGFQKGNQIGLKAKKPKGKNHYSWNKFRSLKLKVRNCPRYISWRKSVFKRDNYICQYCKEKGGKLNVDHIKSFSLIWKENNIKSMKQALLCKEFWDINNGLTLCIDCHKKTDTYLKNVKIIK